MTTTMVRRTGVALAVVLVSLERKSGTGSVAARLRGLGYGLASGLMFGLFFLFFRSAGASGVLWPVAVARLAGTTIAFGACLVAWVRPVWPGSPRGALPPPTSVTSSRHGPACSGSR